MTCIHEFHKQHVDPYMNYQTKLSGCELWLLRKKVTKKLVTDRHVEESIERQTEGQMDRGKPVYLFFEAGIW